MMGLATIVLIDAGIWAAWSAAVGYACHRLPADRLAVDGYITRLRGFERGGRVYEHIWVRRWKSRLPDAGGMFRGGVGKRHLPGRDRAGLEVLARETRRAELVHWLIPAIAPFFALWNPLWLFAAMVVYAVIANLPFLVVQRYNRARVLRVLG